MCTIVGLYFSSSRKSSTVCVRYVAQRSSLRTHKRKKLTGTRNLDAFPHTSILTSVRMVYSATFSTPCQVTSACWHLQYISFLDNSSSRFPYVTCARVNSAVEHESQFLITITIVHLVHSSLDHDFLRYHMYQDNKDC